MEPEPADDAAAAPEAQPEVNLVGSQVGKYRVLRVLGHGGMGAVYEAVHEAIGQRIAIKVLRAELSSDTRHVQRFFDEARAVNIVRHPGLIKAYDFGHLPDGTAYITMEFLEGETLQERLNRLQRDQQRLELIDILRIARQVGSALEAVHAKGIAHRDLKPANLFLVPDKESPSGERAKLLDFGIAKFYDSSKLGEQTGGSQSQHLTTMGKLLGTPAYMSPEQCSGAVHVDAAIDVYALGVILYQMVAGRLPFEAPLAVLIMTKHLTEPPPALSAAELAVPPQLCELVLQMLAKNPKDRPGIAQVVLRLEQLLEAETGASSREWRSQHRRRWHGRRRWQLYLLGVGVVLASVLIVMLGKQRRAQRRALAAAASAVTVVPESARAEVVAQPHIVPAVPAGPVAPTPTETVAVVVPENPAPGERGHKRSRSAKAAARQVDRTASSAPGEASGEPVGSTPVKAIEVPILR